MLTYKLNYEIICVMKLKNLNKLVTGNWYIRNGILYVEYKRFSEGAFGMPVTTFKYISEERIENG